MTAPTESIGWQGWSRVFGGLEVDDRNAPALQEAQLDDKSQPLQGVFPLANEAFGPDSADGWEWL